MGLALATLHSSLVPISVAVGDLTAGDATRRGEPGPPSTEASLRARRPRPLCQRGNPPVRTRIGFLFSCVVMVPPTNKESSTVPVSTSEDEVELEEQDLLAKSKRIKLSESIVQPQEAVEMYCTENRVPDVLSLKIPAVKDPVDELTDCAVQSTDPANGCKGHLHRISFRGNESARSKLRKICTATGWKEPLYDFDEQGPPHNKLFTCKVTVHLDTNTVMECFSDPKGRKKAAQEHAAQGALWYLARCGHV
ncbi:hypothetical protein ACP70R_006835 [Stipagrostis hirtigluma subsp. patula]